MAPVPVQDDYYAILGVVQTAPTATIKVAYRKLALKHHPDKNRNNPKATEIVQAWEILQDETERRAYDRDYARIRQAYEAAERAKKDQADAEKARREQELREEAIRERARQAEAQKAKEESERKLREEVELRQLEASFKIKSEAWSKEKTVLDNYIFEANRKIRRLETELKYLEDIDKAEKAEKEREKSWGTWLSSPFYKKIELAEEDKMHKEQERLERMHKKKFKTISLNKEKENVARWELALKQGAYTITNHQNRVVELKRKEEERVCAKEEARARERIRLEREAEAKSAKDAWESWKRTQKAREEAKERENAARKRAEDAAKAERIRKEKEEQARIRKEEQERWERLMEEQRKRSEREEAAQAERVEEQRKAKLEQERRDAQARVREAATYAAKTRAGYGKQFGSDNSSSKSPFNENASTEFGGSHARKSRSERAATSSFSSTKLSSCSHQRYWKRVDGAGNCSKCSQHQWKFLFQCPDCNIRTCADCRKTLKGR